MIIEKLHITSFGQLADADIELSSGTNVIEGGNESGKSTVAAFIKFILYGMRDPNERRLYINWNGASASGSMTARRLDGSRVRIERMIAVDSASGAARERVSMTDAETGVRIDCGKCPGEFLLGVPEDVFAGTAFVRQIGGAYLDGAKMSAAAENLLFSADEAINTKKAAEKLDAVRRSLRHKNGRGGSLYEMETERAALSASLEDAKRASSELIAVESSIADLTAKRETATARREQTRRKIAGYETVLNLHRFDQLNSAKDELAALYRKKDAILTEGLVGSHFPDDQYIAELRAVNDGMTATASSIASISRRLDELRDEETMTPDRELCERFADDEAARDEIRGEFDDLTMRKRALGTSSIGTILVAIICAVLVVLNRNGGSAVVIPLSIATATFAVAAVIMAIVSLVADSQSERRLRYYGAADREALASRLDELSLEAKNYRELGERIAAAEAERYVQYSVYDDEKAEARRLLSLRGLDPDDAELPSVLSETIAACESLRMRDDAISSDILRGRGEVEELTRRLDGVSEDEVRAEAEAVNADEFASISAVDLRRERDFTENAVTKLTEAIHAQELRRTQLLATREDPAAISVKLDALDKKIAEENERYESCVLAIDALSAAGSDVRQSVAPHLRSLAREYLSRVTEGKYDELGVDAAFAMSVSADGAYRELDLLSAGTADAAYLSLRLALVKLLYRSEPPTLVFDESLCRMDDRRASGVLSLIAGGELQAVFLTCQDREARLFAGIDPDVRIIKL